VWLQIVALGLVYPSVLLIYFGEAAYLMHNTQDFAQSYFKVNRCQDARSWSPVGRCSLCGQQTMMLYLQKKGYKELITMLQRNAAAC